MWNDKGQICLDIVQVLELNKLKSSVYTTLQYGGDKFQIHVGRGNQYVVDLAAKNFSCRKWNLTGILCTHGCSAIHFSRKKPECVSSWYMKEKYFAAYGNLIQPMDGMNLWESTNKKYILPCNTKRQPRRPKKTRIKDSDENDDKLGRMG